MKINKYNPKMPIKADVDTTSYLHVRISIFPVYVETYTSLYKFDYITPYNAIMEVIKQLMVDEFELIQTVSHHQIELTCMNWIDPVSFKLACSGDSNIGIQSVDIKRMQYPKYKLHKYKLHKLSYNVIRRGFPEM